MKKESYLYKKLSDKKVRCDTCSHKCIIKNGKYGFCGVRKNINGKLYFMLYAMAVAENIDPIEKKPLFDYLPGTNTLTFATCGCNFCCKWCQNYDISQISKSNNKISSIRSSFELSPERIVKDAILNQCPSISYSYTEPTIYFEYALDTMKLANKKGLKNIWVTNGYVSSETLKLTMAYIDAVNIDIKCLDKSKYNSFTSGRLEPVIENIKNLYKNNKHIEITTLVVPTLNDKKSELLKIAKWIVDNLNKDVPWHITRYYPAFKMDLKPVTKELLTDTQKMAKNLGLKKVYLGNI